MSNFVTTKAGTQLQLLNLKGKSYLGVAQRILWFVEENPSYTTNVNFLVLDDTQAVAQVTVAVFDAQGKLVRQVTDIKRETKQDFNDFAEKAVTGALGRNLNQLGYGTAFALDLDEGIRIVDAPQGVAIVTASTGEAVATSEPLTTVGGGQLEPKATARIPSFRRPGATKVAAAASNGSGGTVTGEL